MDRAFLKKNLLEIISFFLLATVFIYFLYPNLEIFTKLVMPLPGKPNLALLIASGFVWIGFLYQWFRKRIIAEDSLKDSLDFYGFNWEWKTVILGAIAGVVTGVVIFFWSGGGSLTISSPIGIGKIFLLVGLWLLAFIFGPIVEEMAFRGFLINPTQF